MLKCEILCRLDESAHNFLPKIITSTFHWKNTAIMTDSSARKTPNPFIQLLEVRSFSWSAPIYCFREISLTEDNSDYFASAIIAIVSKLIGTAPVSGFNIALVAVGAKDGFQRDLRISRFKFFPFRIALEEGTITLKMFAFIKLVPRR